LSPFFFCVKLRYNKDRKGFVSNKIKDKSLEGGDKMNFFLKVITVMVLVFIGYIYSPSISSVMSEHKTGEWIEIEGILYKVTHVKIEKMDNHTSVQMVMELKNKTKEGKEIDYLMFALLDQEGHTYTPNITDQLVKGTKGEISGMIQSEEYKKGMLFFTIPTEAKGIKLTINSPKNTIYIEKNR